MPFARRPPADTSVVAPHGVPATVRSFSHAGATLVVESFGRGARTFLFLHGIGMGRLAFRGLAGHLRGRGRFIAVDLPGYGAAPEPPRILTMARTADLLAALLAHPNVVLTRERLLDLVWGLEFPGGTRTVDMHVASLRRKLGRPGLVRTVRGVGYKVARA